MSDEAAGIRKVTIRMYREGLGDSFLIGFHSADGEARWMLVDCGAIDRKGKPVSMKEVASDIALTTRDDDHPYGHLRRVVISNTRMDHVSGFIEAAAIFKKMTVDEVWLPATEDTDDEQARSRKLERRKRLARLQGVARSLPDTAKDLARSLTGVLNLFSDCRDGQADEAIWSVSSAAALPSLCEWERKGSRIVYLDTRTPPRPIFSDLPDGRAYVLGPRAESDIRGRGAGGNSVSGDGSLDLADSFLSAAHEPPGMSPEEQKAWKDVLERNLPFSPICQIKLTTEAENGEERLKLTPPLHTNYFEKHYFAEEERWRRIDHDWMGVARSLTLALDRSVNNESLALALELSAGGKVLLFSGDAQLGAWKSWDSLRWTVADNAEKRRVTACDLLRRTTLYKVSHRCSQTGTMIEGGLDLMTSGSLIALLPVNRAIAEKLGWDFPYAPLLQSLREKTRGRILISDPDEPRLEDRDRPEQLTRTGWDSFRKEVRENSLYIEYTLNV